MIQFLADYNRWWFDLWLAHPWLFWTVFVTSVGGSLALMIWQRK